MKFTKEQCLEPINAFLGTTKLMSDRSILESLETLLPIISTDEMELTDFIEKVKPLITTTNNNIRHEQSVFAKDFIEKNKPKPEEPKPVDPIVQPQGGFTLEQITAAITAATQPLQSQLDAISKKSAKDKLLHGVDSIVASWGVNPERQGILNLAKEMELSTIADDATVESLATRLKTRYESVLAATGVSNGYQAPKGEGGDGEDQQLKATLSAIESAETANGSDGLKSALGIK